MNPGEFGEGFGMDYNRDIQMAKRHVRDLLQKMIDDVAANEDIDSYDTAQFEDIVYRLMDQV